MRPFRPIVLLVFFSLLGLILLSCLTLALNNMGVGVDGVYSVRVMQGVGQLLTFVLPCIAVVLYFKEPMKEFFRFRSSCNVWKAAVCGAVIITLFTPLVDHLGRWNESLHLPKALYDLEQQLRVTAEVSSQMTNNLLSVDSVGMLLFNLLILAVMPSVCEELFFRGTLQNYLHRWFRNSHVAILVAAALFSLAHGDVFNFLPRFLLGVILGYLYLSTNSIWVNITAHFVNNAIIVVLYAMYHNGFLPFSPDEMPSVSLVWTIVASLGALALMWYVPKRFVRHSVR